MALRAPPPPQAPLLALIAFGANEPASTIQEPGGKYRTAVATGCVLYRSTLRSGGQAGHAGAEDGYQLVYGLKSPEGLCPALVEPLAGCGPGVTST